MSFAPFNLGLNIVYEYAGLLGLAVHKSKEVPWLIQRTTLKRLPLLIDVSS